MNLNWHPVDGALVGAGSLWPHKWVHEFENLKIS
jgi:hypothetical protein